LAAKAAIPELAVVVLRGISAFVERRIEVVSRGEWRPCADGRSPRRSYRPSMTDSTTSAASRRDAVDFLIDRLGRLHASTVTLRTAAADVRADGNQTTLNGVLDDLERDLRLASGETASVRRAFRTALLP